jgi:benzoylformate decarboxylase
VFLGLPMDVLAEVGSAALPAVSRVDDAPRAGSLLELADLLAGAERPAIVAGNELARANGLDDAVALAEALGAPVFGAPLYASTVFPTTHPLWCGPLAMSAAGIAEALGAFDRVLLLGASAFLVYPYTPANAVPAGVELLQVHPDAAQVGRTHAVALGVVGDPAEAARELTELLRGRVPDERRARALEAGRATHEAATARLAEQIEQGLDSVPLSPAAAVAAVYSRLPPDAVVVDESITASPFTRALNRGADPLSFLWCGAGALGWGLPAAVGVKLARPDRAVVALCGDGSTLYAPQALWSAARDRVPVVVVVLDNREYRILKHGLDQMDGASARTGRYVGMDIDEPRVDFVALARSFGVAGRSVGRADELADAVEEALAAGAPRLVHVPIAGHVPR